MSSGTSEPVTLLTVALGGAAIAAGAMRYGAKSTQAVVVKRLEEEAMKLERLMQSKTTLLENNVEQIRGSFQSHLTSLSTANQRLQGIENNLQETNRTLFGPLSRGKFGELELELLVNDCMPRAAKFQYTLSNGNRADCVLNLPPPIGKLSIDAKFPLDAFQPFLEINSSGSATVNNVDKTNVKKAMKVHIDAISKKYIIPGETADYAIMFLPSEAIFHVIARDFHDVLFQANRERVYLASPTTLMALLAQLRLVSNKIALHDMEGDVLKYVDSISDDAGRLAERFKAAHTQLDNSKNSLDKMSISVRKIQQTCQKIAEAKQLATVEDGVGNQDN
jgi:DNA recombination protein RmuC